MSEADSISPRPRRGMNGSSEGSAPTVAGGRPPLGVAPGVAQPAVEGGRGQDLALLGGGAPGRSAGSPRRSPASRSCPVFDRSITAATLTSSRKLATAVETSMRGVEAHLPQPAADARHRVEQLVAHDPEGGVKALRRPEQLLLDHLLLRRRPRRATSSRQRGGPRRARRLALSAHASTRPFARARHGHVQEAPNAALRCRGPRRQALLQQGPGHPVDGSRPPPLRASAGPTGPARRRGRTRLPSGPPGP